MLLQQIVALLDGELDRLSRLREIVSGLAGPAVFETREQEPLEAAEAVKVDALLQPGEARSRRIRSAQTERKPRAPRIKAAPEPTALSGAIPTSPIVVTAEALAREGIGTAHRAVKKPNTATPAPGSLGSMIRALRLEVSS